MKLRSLAISLLLAMTLTPWAVAAPHSADLKDLMRKEFDAWSTLDMKKVAPFYAQGPDYVFYDLTPLKYTSWADYEAGVNKVIANLASVKFTIHNDAQTHQHGHLAWGTATMLVELVTREGKHEQLEARWTAIWEKHGRNWVIVHEHFSAPAP